MKSNNINDSNQGFKSSFLVGAGQNLERVCVDNANVSD